MKKSILKSSLACLAAASIGFIGYTGLSNSVKAQPNYDLSVKKVDDNQTKDMIGVKQATELNVVYRLSETLDKLLLKKKSITDNQLEILSFFAFQYLNSQNTYISSDLDSQIDPITLLTKVQAVAEMSKLDPYFKITENKVEVIKKIDSPENFDEILASIESQVKDQLLDESKEDSLEVDVLIDESNDLLEVVESHEN